MAAGKKRATSKRKRAAEKLRRVAHGSTAENDSKPKMNPFEFRANKRAKNAVFGRRIKGAKRNVSVARSEANERRKNTLLLEYKNKNRSNAFIDRRLGERDHGLTAEDKILMRFQRQRAKELQKKSRFALGDGDDNDDGPEALTHMGQTMGTGFDFGEDGRLSDSDDADMDADFTSQMNFGGGFEAVGAGGSDAGGDGDGVANGDVAKTRREVMMDIIKKSKERRHEKRVEKDARDAEMDELDAGLADIQGLLDFRGKKTDGKGSDAKKADRKKALGATPKYDDFDSLAHEMRMATKKAAPTNKLESASDAALREKLRLEALERDRVRRMEGDFGDDGDEDRVTGGDDLDDAYDLDPELLPGGAAGSAAADETAADDTAADETDDEAEAAAQAEAERRAEAGEWSSEEDFERDADRAAGWLPSEATETDPEEAAENARKSKKKKKYEKEEARRQAKKRRRAEGGDARLGAQADSARAAGPALGGRLARAAAEAAAKEMPYTFACPADYAELESLFAKWVEGSDADAVPGLAETLLHRVRACNSAHHRGGENVPKLGRLLGLVLRRLAEVVEDPECAADPQKAEAACALADALGRSCWDIAREVPREAQRLFLAHVDRIQSQVGTDQSFPPAGDLALLRLVPALFSSSDFRHPVATPAMLLLAQILQQCRVRSPRDAAAGLLAAEGLLVAARAARRATPEASNFLAALLARAVDGSDAAGGAAEAARAAAARRCPTMTELPPVLPFRPPASEKDVDAPLARGALGLVVAARAATRATSLPAGALLCAVRLLQRASAAQSGSSTHRQQFADAAVLLETLGAETSALPTALRAPCTKAATKLKRASSSADGMRRPLQLQKRQVRSIKQFAPQFDEDFQPGHKKKDIAGRRRAEEKSLKRRVKSERKAAVRELRQDNAFLGRARDAENAKREKRQADKYREVMNFLQEQQATFHQMVKQGNNVGGGSGGGGRKQKARLTRTDGR
jgi:nucleolar protein 14